MKQRFFRSVRCSALLAAAFLLAGCPYGSDYPIGSPADAVAEDALLGTWKATGEDEEQLTVTIRSSGERGYVITAENPEEDEPESLQAFVSALDGERFLNIQEEQWYFANYRILDGRLLLRIVDDALFGSRTFAAPEDLRAFLRENLGDPRLYGEADGQEWDWVLDRVTPP
jgi:hypothetical protein